MPPARPKSALIIGAFGQDGHYLSEHLMGQGYEVTRVGRNRTEGRCAAPIDILDRGQVFSLVDELVPAEIYYLAAFHHSAEDAPPPFEELLATSMRVHVDGLVNVLEAVVNVSPASRVFQASSALVFGEAERAPQNEDTPLQPTTPYGVSKVAAMGACRLYRESHGTFAVSGILFNHESPRRGTRFVSRKIAIAAARAAMGAPADLRLGALEAEVDWSAAEDVMRAAHAMLQMGEPIDCVIASGKLHTVRDFARLAFETVGLDYRDHITQDETILHRRAGDVPRLGDSSRLRKATGFAPSISFDDMVRAMVHAEMESTA